jgi:hypothetical protein
MWFFKIGLKNTPASLAGLMPNITSRKSMIWIHFDRLVHNTTKSILNQTSCKHNEEIPGSAVCWPDEIRNGDQLYVRYAIFHTQQYHKCDELVMQLNI